MHGVQKIYLQKGLKAREGFTLVELLVVIAITAVLFALLLVPLVQAVRLTQRAQIVAAAQDSARKTLEQVAREAGSAVYVFDNASHPLTPSGGTFVAGDDKFTNFLNLQVVTKTGAYAVAHAYNSKLDLVPARHAGDGPTALIDPTTGGNDPVNLSKSGTGSVALGDTGALFPLAPGSTIIRYFVGLKRPAVNYANSNEKLNGNTNPGEDNSYILYRAQVAPYTYMSKGTGAATTYARTTNLLYFDTGTDGKPELDDPDFFRYVTTSDVNWLDAGHNPYTAAQVTAHNMRVDNWVKIAKPVITAPAIDLLIVPHNPDGTVAFDTSGTFNGIAHQGSTTDPVPTTPVQYPTVKTSVTFAPATLTADAAPSSTTAYGEEGVPTDAADNSGLPYVPTVYTASNQSWGYPYNLTLFQYQETAAGVGGYTTSSVQRFRTDIGSVTLNMVQYTDMIEYLYVDSMTEEPVYDVTAGIPLAAAMTGGAYPGRYVPMIVNSDTGTINFAVPALPDPNDKFQRFWTVSIDDLNGSVQPTPTNPNIVNGVLDLTNNAVFANTPLVASGTAPANAQVANAYIVPGSVRVYGPDATPGPNLGSSVLYSPVSPGTPLGFNQYRLDVLNSTLSFFVTGTESLPSLKASSTPTTPVLADPVKIAFDYQANLSPTRATLLEVAAPPPVANTAISDSNPARPLQVKVDYQTRDLLDVNIGVRVYDPTDGHALTIPQSTRVQIGNPNR